MRQALHIVCSTCLGVCIIGITSCQYEMSSPPPEENNWETYEDMSESAHLAAGKCVFVFVYSEINAMSLPAFSAFNDSNFQRLCMGNAYVLLLLKYNDWSDLRLRISHARLDSRNSRMLFCFRQMVKQLLLILLRSRGSDWKGKMNLQWTGVGKPLDRDGEEARGASGEGVTAESPVTLY